MPAHHGAAEHAWKDGDSGRRGQRHAAIVDLLTHDGLGHSENGGGVFATSDAVLCAIMENATGAWLVGAKGEYPLHRPYLHGSDESHPMAVTTAPAGLGTPEDRSRLLAIFLDDKGAQIVSDG